MEEKKPPRRRSSFFGTYNLTSSRAEAVYVEQLQKEDREWQEILMATNKKFKTYWRSVREGQQENDERPVLSKEKNEFLNKRIDMTIFREQTQELAEEVDLYVHRKQWFLEKYDMFIEELQDKEVENRVKLSRKMKQKFDTLPTSPPVPRSQA